MNTKIKVISGVAALVAAAAVFQGAIVLAASSTAFSQTIVDGVQSVDVVDSTGTTVASPAVGFSPVTFSFNSQTTTGSLGTSSQRIRVLNPTSHVTWGVSVAATGGPTATWSSGTSSYAYNDSSATGGRLTLNPSAATIGGVPDNTTCSPNTGITKGSSASFQAINPAVNSITLLTGAAGSSPYCRWDITGVGLSQVIPAAQISGTYTMSFTITIA